MFSKILISIFVTTFVSVATTGMSQTPLEDSASDGSLRADIQWSATTDGLENSLEALADLYTSLNELGALSTDTVAMEKSDRNITDTMIRNRSWPPFYRNVNRELESLLCELNVENDNCRFSSEGVPRWVAGPGDDLVIPDYDFHTVYVPTINAISEPDGSFPSLVTDTAKVLCAHGVASNCAGVPGFGVPTDFPETAAAIITGDQVSYDDLQVNDVILDNFSKRSGATSMLAAYPEIQLDLSVTFPDELAKESFIRDNQRNLSVVTGVVAEQQSLPDDKMVMIKEIQQEMGFRSEDGERISLEVTPESMDREFYIFHFDQQVKFEHCFFDSLKSQVNFRSLEDRVAQFLTWENAEIFKASDTDCDLEVNEQLQSGASHGSQTMAALADLILTPELTGEQFNNADDIHAARRATTNIMHFPVKIRGDSLAEPEVFERALLSISQFSKSYSINPIIVISLSWDAFGAEKIARIFVDHLENAHIFVAAPRLEANNACARHPAGIRNGNGDLQSNILSVVGWNAEIENDALSVSRFDIEQGSYGKCHDLGAIGVQVGPVLTDNQMATARGSSVATPIVAAAAVNILRAAPDDLEPSELFARLLLGSDPPDSSSAAAKAKFINLDASTNFELSRIDVLKGGNRCIYWGELEKITPRAAASIPFRTVNNQTGPSVNLDDLYRFHRRGAGNFFWVVHERDDTILAQDLRVRRADLTNRFLSIDVKSNVADNANTCLKFNGGGSIEFPLSDILDVFHNEI